MTAHPPEATNLVAGRPMPGERYPVVDPGRRSRVVGIAHAADPDTVDAAVASAVAAAPSWADTALEDRIAALTSARDGLVADGAAADWPTLLTSEQGKVRAESEFEVGRAPALVDLFAPLARAALADERLDDQRGHLEVGHQPVGPVAAITPWNWPVSLSLGKVVPALLTGNPVILKPAPNTPLAVTEIVGALARRLPPGVVGLLHGGAEVGSQLVADPRIRKVVFTGSTANGAKVYAAAGGTIKNLTLELGGNDPAVLLPDVELTEPVLRSLLAATFVTSGQVCWAIKRMYLPRARYGEFVTAFAEMVDSLVLGHGLDPDATIGPVNNQAQLAVVDELVEAARRDGATVRPLGRRTGDADPSVGNYYPPTLVTELGNDAALVSGEQFGPALPVVAYDTVEDAVRMANATPFGLCASVWSPDRERAFAVARRLRAGQVYVNAHAGAALDYSRGFGGIGQSGLGREMGVAGIRAYTEPRVLSDRVLR